MVQEIKHHTKKGWYKAVFFVTLLASLDGAIKKWYIWEMMPWCLNQVWKCYPCIFLLCYLGKVLQEPQDSNESWGHTWSLTCWVFNRTDIWLPFTIITPPFLIYLNIMILRPGFVWILELLIDWPPWLGILLSRISCCCKTITNQIFSWGVFKLVLQGYENKF